MNQDININKDAKPLVKAGFQLKQQPGQPSRHFYYLRLKQITDGFLEPIIREIEQNEETVREEHYQLQILISKNRIGPKGAALLARADLRNLVDLNIWDNQIRDQGCKHLSKANWSALKNLNLCRNNIGQKGCTYLANAEWQSLKVLDLGRHAFTLEWNPINWQGYKYLSRKFNACNIRHDNKFLYYQME